MSDLPLVPGLAALVVGVVLGGLAASTWLQASPLPAPAPVAAVTVSCDEQVQALSDETTRLSAEKLRLDTQVVALRRRRAAARGQTRPWPEAPLDPLTRDAIETHLDRVLKGSPATLEELDCEAYPCVAVLSWSVPAEERDLVDAGDGEANLSGALLALLSEGSYGSLPFWHTGRLVGEGTQASVHAFTWMDPQDYSDAKGEDPGQAVMDGTVMDAVHGRAEEVLETWLDDEAPAPGGAR